MTVAVSWAVDARPLTDRDVCRTVEAALSHGGRGGIDVDVVLVDDGRLAELHARFLGDASPTDVMAFDLGEEGGGPVGEIYVSVDCAVRVARERGVRVERELALYLVHGALHLCGFDDVEDRERAVMRGAEADVLRGLGWEDDLGAHEG